MNLDFYCERLSDQFWAEPVNAITNLGFVLVGLWGLIKIKKQFYPWTFVISLLSIFVGGGSFLFHTYANSKTHLLDLIPIFILTLVFVYFTFSRVLKMNSFKSSSSLFVFLILMVMIEILVPKSLLNGSLLYFPALMTLVWVSTQDLQIAKFYKIAALIFFVSLLFRTLDQQVCEWIPIGTHFLWHLFNSALLGVMIQITWEVGSTSRYTKPS